MCMSDLVQWKLTQLCKPTTLQFFKKRTEAFMVECSTPFPINKKASIKQKES